MRIVSLRHLLASTAIASCIILTGSVASFSATSNGGSKTLPSWSPKSSERLVKLPPSYLKKSLDRDLAESQLGTAIKSNNENIGQKGNTLSDLQRAIETSEGEMRLELRHQFLAEKRAYLDLMERQIDLDRKQAKTRLRLYERMLKDFGNKKANKSAGVKDLVEKQTLARDRFKSSLAQVDLKVFETASFSQSRYAVKHGKNVQAIEKLLNHIKQHNMNQSLTADGVEMTKEEFIRHMATDAEVQLALADQDDTILGYMAKLVALDAMALSEETMDADDADSPFPGTRSPAQDAPFFMTN
jgi:hypothetical protein